MPRRLFCELSPAAYRLSTLKCKLLRHAKNVLSRQRFALTKNAEPLPVLLYAHNSLIRRKLGNVDTVLQDNKAINLGLAAPKVSHVLIRPGEVFSFWRLVGNCTAKKGYRDGVTLSSGRVESGVGGGMCQFTNLIHWMVLHTPLEITEHHHHDGLDLFPDFNRQIPFGTGTSIMYNYLDYRFKNTGDNTFQLIVYTTDTHLCGELRAEKPLAVKYHIKAEGEAFLREDGQLYRVGKVYRACIDPSTGNCLSRELIKQNHARVLYERSADGEP